jgi:hypothetical protein
MQRTMGCAAGDGPKRTYESSVAKGLQGRKLSYALHVERVGRCYKIGGSNESSMT